ncbi:MAG: sugar phosphate isomerase [Planctomycetia bacterium]|nr:sugar phosphate isomerase [Planctomycetia bacterium]
MIRRSPVEKAREFIQHETQFHLGCLPTEQSHPKTRTLSQKLQSDPATAILMIQSVDDDLPPVLARVIRSTAFEKLVSDMTRVLRHGGRIHFSGCGATGRLAILLDAAARRYWRKTLLVHPEIADWATSLADQTNAVMTGGDFALIRSVESFEDYLEFGRRQMQEAGVRKDDLVVAISEGGETSSVIGTIHAALDCGAAVSFLFNNPADILSRHVERSEKVISDSRVNVLDLSTGPMAVAGSTRMQATTMELLVAGMAWEAAITNVVREIGSDALTRKLNLDSCSPNETARNFDRLLNELRADENVRTLADYVQFESEIYASGGLITYFADSYLLDIFTDTTERAPTFKTPPFRPADDGNAPLPWSFVKTPLRTTQAAWQELLAQEPRCLTWTSSDYQAMNGPDAMIVNPPRLDRAALYRYEIGNEPDETRWSRTPNAAVAFLVGQEPGQYKSANSSWSDAFYKSAQYFESRKNLWITDKAMAAEAGTWSIRVHLPETPLDLFGHLAAKLVLNTISTAALGRIGRLSGNWMAHVEASNKKLIDRSTRLIVELAHVDYETACITLFETLQDMESWPEARKKITSPAAWSVAKLQSEACTKSGKEV